MTDLTGRLRRRAAAEGFTMSSAAEDGRLLTALAAPLSGIAREEIVDPRVEWVIADGGDWLTAAVTREDR
jgi:hypothetical protein